MGSLVSSISSCSDVMPGTCTASGSAASVAPSTLRYSITWQGSRGFAWRTVVVTRIPKLHHTVLRGTRLVVEHRVHRR